MILNIKVRNYKILDLVELYNFGLKFVFIQDHIRKLWIFFMRPFLGADHAISHP